MSQAANFNIITSPPAPIGGQTTRISESFAALLTRNSGSSGTRPAYITTAGKGEWTQEVSGTNWALYYFDGTHDVLLGTINPTTGAFTTAGDMSALGGAAWGAETSIASASTTTLASVSTYRALVTGTVTITSFGTGVNLRRQVRFSGALTLTHNGTSLILPGAQDITTVAGDIANFESDGSSNWRCVNYFRDGVPLWMQEAEASIASATTTDLSTKRSRYINITGTVTITGFGTGANLDRVVRFSGALTLTYNATSLILPTAANITTAAGDIAFLRSDGSGNWRCLTYQRADGTALVTSTLPSFAPIQNLTVATGNVSNTAVTSIKTQAGTDATATDKIRIPFRSSTLASGAFNIRDVTSALSITIPSGATLGHASTVAGRLYYYAIDNSGTVELAVSSLWFGESGIVSTTTISSGATSSQVMYSATGRSNVPFRALFMTLDTQTTAGTWTSGPSEVSLWPFGVFPVRYYREYTTFNNFTTQTPYDDTIPQVGEGTEIMTATIVPRSRKIYVRTQVPVAFGANDQRGWVHVHKDGAANAVLAAPAFISNSYIVGAQIIAEGALDVTPGTAVTISVRVGPGGAYSLYVNGNSSSREGGGVGRATLVIEEMMQEA